MQLSAIRTDVRVAAGFDASDPLASDTQLNSLINRAVRTVNAMRDWDWRKASETITTANGTTAYARNARAIRTIRIEDTEEGDLLEMITPEAATRYNDMTGRPVFWFVEDGEINFVPTPDGVRTFKHVYLQDEATLSDDTDEPLVPDDAIDMVILNAAISLLARTDDTSQARLLERELTRVSEAQLKNARRARGAAIVKTRRDWSRYGTGL